MFALPWNGSRLSCTTMHAICCLGHPFPLINATSKANLLANASQETNGKVNGKKAGPSRATTSREMSLEVAEPVGWAQRKPRTKRVKRCDVGRSCRRMVRRRRHPVHSEFKQHRVRFHHNAPMLGVKRKSHRGVVALRSALSTIRPKQYNATGKS